MPNGYPGTGKQTTEAPRSAEGSWWTKPEYQPREAFMAKAEALVTRMQTKGINPPKFEWID